jgi:formate hydrogenlyase subunit 3/multisubunit Na+/H+ antiporter MnhD subunit
MPLFSILFFIFTCANMAVPLSANWIGEFISLAGTFQFNPIITLVASTSIVLSACYSIFLFNRLSFGQWSTYIYPIIDIQRVEFHVLLPLLIITFVLGLYPNIILDYLHLGSSSLIYTPSPFLLSYLSSRPQGLWSSLNYSFFEFKERRQKIRDKGWLLYNKVNPSGWRLSIIR